MGRLKNTTESLQFNDDLLSLLRLSNELLHMILSYLSSGDIARAFWNINSDRIQGLIQEYFPHFNLTNMINNEVKWYLNQSRLSDCLLSLRLTDDQMKFISKLNIQFIQLSVLHIIQIADNKIFDIDILRMAPLIRSFVLDFSIDEMSHNSVGCLARIIFSKKQTWLEQMEKLSINHIRIPFGYNSLQSMHNLRDLTINLRCEKQLFELPSCLPRIESLCVHIHRSSPSMDDFSSFNPVDVSPYLKKLIIRGEFSSHLVLYKFILVYKSSLEYLKLIDIVHQELVDGHQLQSELMQHLSPTLRFYFQFQFHVNRQDLSLDSYRKTFNWAQVMIKEDTVSIQSKNFKRTATNENFLF